MSTFEVSGSCNHRKVAGNTKPGLTQDAVVSSQEFAENNLGGFVGTWSNYYLNNFLNEHDK